MVKVNRPLVGAFAVFLFLLTCFTGWFSFNSYLNLFQLNDVIIFSWKVGLMVFGSPLLFYFSYLAFYSVIKNEVPRMNNKLANVLVIIFISGAVISFVSSVYITYTFNVQGYEICPKNSWMDPNKYVKNIALCDEW
ncbi:DUF1240 domain-containing protein [Pectobacterium carotovorum]|uniref:DUF1240 domain-containing protein n=1 Tax=Pectobacterium carotovorum TaxID=554 RepID=UPI000D73349B|nr:DUF1240 domain-containing protein [Pectobacterium carotovorum]PXB03578.1 hypothetical protein DMB41_03670 [Pectobacterium carotovorum subsp. carotovorum]